MQEEVDSRTIALVINSAKLTGRVFKGAIDKYIAYCKNKKLQKQTVIPHGKQSVKQLIGQNQGVTTFESNDIDVKGFERYARKYGVDYAIKKVRDNTGKAKFIVFFKGRDKDAIDTAMREYVANAITPEKKPSITKKLQEMGGKEQNKVLEISKTKQRGQTR